MNSWMKYLADSHNYEVYYDLYFEPNILSPIGKMQSQSQQMDFPSI